MKMSVLDVSMFHVKMKNEIILKSFIISNKISNIMNKFENNLIYNLILLYKWTYKIYKNQVYFF